MAQIALEVQNTAPRDPLAPAAATVDSSYAEALDSVSAAQTHLYSIADYQAGSIGRDLPWHRGVVEEASRVVDALNSCLRLYRMIVGV